MTERFAVVFAAMEKDAIPAEIDQIIEFVDVGEYGLALEQLADLIVIHQRELPTEALQMLGEIADIMDMRRQIITPALSACVRSATSDGDK
jgi:hypothetical protein